MPFRDRADAGRRLADALEHLRGADSVVLGLPRGGVPVAYEVAAFLGAPLDIAVVRKLGAPSQPELALGAIGEGGVRVLNENVLAATRVSGEQLAAIEEEERAKLTRLVARLRGNRPPTEVAGRTAILVDDGIATGSSAQAACQVVVARGAAKVVVAVPVAPGSSLRALADFADEVVCLESPRRFFAVGQWYQDFSQVSDEEVATLLGRQRPAHRLDVEIHVPDGPRLPGRLVVPWQAAGVVVFAHGSGSSRLSPRNRFVAGVLEAGGLATLLFDLLTPEEAGSRANVFDIGLLAERIVAATRWLAARTEVSALPVGFFGASTGAGAALVAAGRLAGERGAGERGAGERGAGAQGGEAIAAVVSRGGRPDLAGAALDVVRAPTLLVVGERDEEVLRLNEEARRRIRCESSLVTVPGATHLFEEPGTLAAAADLARDWFLRHIGGEPPAPRRGRG